MIQPLDGAVKPNGAVWRAGCWHLVRIAEDGGTYSAVCSCEWVGPKRAPRRHRFLTAAVTLAYADGERHAWSVPVCP